MKELTEKQKEVLRECRFKRENARNKNILW